MKRLLAFTCILACLFGLFACGTAPQTPASAPETNAASDPVLKDPKLAAMRGRTVRELLADPEIGITMLQRALCDTAISYFYHDPDVQYEMISDKDTSPEKDKGAYTTVISSKQNGGMRRTHGVSPEFAAPDTEIFYQCSQFSFETYYNTFNTKPDGTGESYETYGATRTWSSAGAPGEGYMRKIDYPASLIFTYRENLDGDVDAAVQQMYSLLQPGDIIETPSHLMIYVGDMFGTGKNYIVHFWPSEGGGCLRNDTGEQMREEDGGCRLQTIEQLLIDPQRGKAPSWRLGYKKGAMSFAVIRPLLADNMLDMYVTDATLTRMQNPNMCIKKTANFTVHQSVLPGETVTVTEVIENHTAQNGDAPQEYTDLPITEWVPEGAKFVSCSEGGKEKDGKIEWTVSVPSGGKAEVSYSFTVEKKLGESVTVPAGSVGYIPTRTFDLKVGGVRLTQEQNDVLLDMAKNGLSDELKAKFSGEFLQTDFVNLFYREVFGAEVGFPKTVNEYVNARFRTENIANTNILMLKDPTPETQYLVNMEIPRFVQGRAVILSSDLLEDNRIRSLDVRENFFTPGDVFIAFGNVGALSRTRLMDENDLTVDIYLGRREVLRYSKAGGAEVIHFVNGPWRDLNKYFFVALRPTMGYENLFEH